ncbi:uncharacterized protein FIBRA_01963 [Fibroporia radiculosa]|uniref:Uncharacterized protein n=1 Tax=Fibroporia radiculosa TaxID=599839 RepID=J4G1A0_9APHY|nr:uncharacterized protein FIBRA_01963 [Fibroporia radiculosa]CCL99938.1 predicted protein [Fibroporia radiculosa]
MPLSGSIDLSLAIQSLHVRIADLGRREQEARNILQYICDQKHVLEAERACLEAQLNPFNRLPTELLIQIFLHYVYADDSGSSNDGSSSFYRPLTLVGICQRWRTVAFAASALWTRVLFSHPHMVSLFLEHSRGARLDLVGGTPQPPYVSSDFFQSIRDALARVRSISWSSCTESVRVIFEAVAGALSLPSLENLDLVAQAPGLSTSRRLSSGTSLPALRTFRLGLVSLSTLPICQLPALRSLTLSFPPGERHVRLELSALCALLSRAPNLHDLILDDAIPVMDVYVLLGSSFGNLQGLQPPYFASKTPIHTRSIAMSQLRRLDWSFAPPQDLWLWFSFLETPSLIRLDLCLNKGSVRWEQSYEHFARNQLISPIIGGAPDPVHLEKLEELSIECVDIEGLVTVLKKLHFSRLKKLALVYIPPHMDRILFLPQLPRQESIFREPRLLLLTNLSLAYLQLDPENFQLMLRYMPLLESFSLRTCPGAGKVICTLSGGSCTNAHRNPTRIWVCSRLREIKLFDCADVKFSCLSGLIRARSASVRANEGSGANAGVAARPDQRPIRPLKRYPCLAQGGPPATPPRKLTVGGASSPVTADTPNRGSVSGWNAPLEVSTPTKIDSVCVDGCVCVSEIEAMTLQELGVSSVVWYP